MKEAAGEANMTVITIVLIAIVLGAGTLIVRNLMNSTTNSSACSACGGSWNGGKCYGSCTTNANGTKSCTGSVDYTKCKNSK